MANKTLFNSPTTTMTQVGEREMVMVRVFDAPRHLVFRAYTDPALIPSWWGPRRLGTRVEALDLRPGGKWRFVNIEPDGTEYVFYGEYLEVSPPERLVSTFVFAGAPSQRATDHAAFEDLGGRTRLTVTSVFDLAEGAEEMLSSGMVEGAVETWDRLAEQLAALQAA
jgi:uncharacterized protein YndB with AHSA1/START domain